MDGPTRKLLFVINILALSGGAEVQLTYLTRGLARLGHEITVCCIDQTWGDLHVVTDEGVEIVELRRGTRLGRPMALPRLTHLAKQAEVVHCTMWDPSLWGRIGGILARRPVIVADHATDRSVQVAASGAPRARWIALHNRLLDPFTYATVACAASQREVLRSEGVSPEKIVHIPNGIPIDDLVRSAAGGPNRAELGLPADAPVALQVGIFRGEKNQRGALEAFAQVREQLPDAQLLFAGEGPLRAEIERQAEAIGASGWTHFLGERRDVPALLSLADIMVLPSLADAMPMTVLEAMALGVAVVATDVGDVRKVLGGAGVCVAAGDTEAFGQACIEVLSSADSRERMGKLGASAAREFDASVMSRRYAALFEGALAGTPPGAVATQASLSAEV